MNLTSTDEKRACFLASTPLQLICCSEAREHYKITHPLMVIVKPDNKPTVDQMKRLADRLGWKDEQIIWMRKNVFYVRLPFVIRNLMKFPFDYIFTGNLDSSAQELIFSRINARLISVDDGMATISQSLRFKDTGFKSNKKNKVNRILNSFMIKTIERKNPNEIHYFSFFNEKSSNGVFFERNRFELFKKIFLIADSNNKEEAIAFIGSPFRNENEYTKLNSLIKTITSLNPGKHVIYFPHRKEKIKTLKKHFSDIDLNIYRPDWPIEIEIVYSKFNFIGLYSYISTALFTIKMLFPNINVYQIANTSAFTGKEFYKNMKSTLTSIGVENIFIDETQGK